VIKIILKIVFLNTHFNHGLVIYYTKMLKNQYFLVLVSTELLLVDWVLVTVKMA